MFCKLEKLLATESVTVLDNKFLINYITDAPEIPLKVYLMGLALAGDTIENNLDAMASKLNLQPQEVLDAYEYWQELGLVYLSRNNPPEVEYLQIRSSSSILKKIKPSKYAKFGKEIQHIINGRMLTVNEYNEYYMFLENTTFQPEALLAVAQYCVDLKGNDITYQYVLTVARNLLQKGALTTETVQEHLNSQRKHDSDIKILFKTLKLNRSIDHSDREMFEQWQKMGFELDVLNYIAKQCKTGGMKKLDSYCKEYYRNGVLSVKEIEVYQLQKDSMLDIAIDVNRTIGVYYQTLDTVVEEYVSRWVQHGYDKQSLHAIALYCFKHSTRTLEGMDKLVNRFYKQGIVSQESIVNYFMEINRVDKLIHEVLENASIIRNVTQSDRALYNTWTNSWNMPHDLIIYIAQNSIGAINAMQYINKVLSNLKQQGIDSVEKAQAKEQHIQDKKAKQEGQHTFIQHEYTDEQLNQLFTDLENVEI